MIWHLNYYILMLIFSFESSDFSGFCNDPSTISGLAGGAGTWTYECKNYGYMIFVVSVCVVMIHFN